MTFQLTCLFCSSLNLAALSSAVREPLMVRPAGCDCCSSLAVGSVAGASLSVVSVTCWESDWVFSALPSRFSGSFPLPFAEALVDRADLGGILTD